MNDLYQSVDSFDVTALTVTYNGNTYSDLIVIRSINESNFVFDGNKKYSIVVSFGEENYCTSISFKVVDSE